MASMQIGGIISGLNTQELIDQLMAIEARPMVLLEEQQEALNVEKAAYAQIRTSLGSLSSALQTLLEAGTWSAKIASSSDEGVVLASADGSAAPGSYSIDVAQLATAHSVASEAQTSSTDPLGYAGTVEINGVAITVTSDMTLEGLRDAINAETEQTGVSAAIIADTLVLTSTETGQANAITLNDPDGIWASLGVWDPTTPGFKNELIAAQDAAFTINGLALTSGSNEVSDAVAGVTVTLRAVGEATVEVRNDTQRIIDKIKAAVSAYNSTHSLIASQTGQEAVLQGESTVTGLAFDLRRSFTGLVGTGSTYELLAEIGITADKEGSLQLDETALREALETDPAAVEKLFTASAAVDGYDGIATRTEALIDRYTNADGILALRDQMYQDRIDRLDESIEAFQERLDAQRERLVAQFTRMEMALAQLQSMGNALSGQLLSLASLQMQS
ncbi:MAG TPA: flagellar filament capping protein FliD [Limnochordia bacterium]